MTSSSTLRHLDLLSSVSRFHASAIASAGDKILGLGGIGPEPFRGEDASVVIYKIVGYNLGDQLKRKRTASRAES